MFSRHLPFITTDEDKITISKEFLEQNMEHFNYNPMIVALRHKDRLYTTGINDFTADNIIIIPSKIATLFPDTSSINVKLVNPELVRTAKMVKIRPISPIFYDIKDLKLALEQKLVNYIVINITQQITITAENITVDIIIDDIIDKVGNSIGNAIILNQDVELEFSEQAHEEYKQYLEQIKKEEEERRRKEEEIRRKEYEKNSFSKVKTDTHTRVYIRNGVVMYVRPDFKVY